MTDAPELSPRALGRATLDRQLLLRRADLDATAVIEHLVGLQAQAPFPPYTGLWTRLVDFDPHHLGQLITERAVVRIALMRGTVHLVTARDALALRPVVQAALERVVFTAYRKEFAEIELPVLVERARALIEQTPRTAAELVEILGPGHPGLSRLALTNAVRTALPLVQLPPRAVWGRSGKTVLTTAQHWLGQPLATDTAPDDLLLRYLAAFGPASVADAQKWSGLTRLGEVVERLRPRLVEFRSADGTRLYDLPDAPRPDAERPAPVRFLPEFDNLLLAYADADRVLSREHRARLFTNNGIIRAAVLVDGRTAGSWQIERTGRTAVLSVQPFQRLRARDRTAIVAEAEALLAFAAADSTDRDVRVLPPN